MVREGDVWRIKSLLESGADPNEQDETGATALMYAGAFAPVDCVRLLLDAGAAVNAASNHGSTALMWSTADASKVRLLLNRRADVNAETKDGGTALLSAALRENVEVLRLLIDAGAGRDAEMFFLPGGGPKMGLAKIAYATNEAAVREFLVRSGFKPPEVRALAPFPGSAPLANHLFSLTFSLRRQAEQTSAGTLSATLDLGANPNEDIRQLNLLSSPLSRLALLGDLGALSVLLKRGADPNRKGSAGLTPLMAAAAADPPNSAALRLLLEDGAILNAQDDQGRTALDWALMQGMTVASRLLRDNGGKTMVQWPASPRPISQPRPVREAVGLVLKRLQTAGVAFHEKGGCISCHHQSLQAIAVKIASTHGLALDSELAQRPAQATFQMWNPSRENFLLGNCSIFGFLGNVSYGLLEMAEEGVPQNSTTDAVVSCLGGLQKPNGSWEGGDARPPLAGRIPIVYTALALRALKVYSPGGMRRQTDRRISSALSFLRSSEPRDTQDEAFKLLGLIWAAAPAAEISVQANRIAVLQHKSGGWSQKPTMSPDAYATGQALYALHAGGMVPSNAAYQKGIRYLLSSQLEDGTWYLRSRAVGFQPYLDSGFPHGADQFISAAATSWASIALAYSL